MLQNITLHGSGGAVDIQKPLLFTVCRTSLLALTIPEGSKVQQHPAVWGRQILSEAHWDARWGHLAEWQGQHILPAKEELRPEPTLLAPACDPPNTEGFLIHTAAVAPSSTTRTIISWWHWGQMRSEVRIRHEFRRGYSFRRIFSLTQFTRRLIWSLYKGSLTQHMCTIIRLPRSNLFDQKYFQLADSLLKLLTMD